MLGFVEVILLAYFFTTLKLSSCFFLENSMYIIKNLSDHLNCYLNKCHICTF